jgi:hypothetical protein
MVGLMQITAYIFKIAIKGVRFLTKIKSNSKSLKTEGLMKEIINPLVPVRMGEVVNVLGHRKLSSSHD